MTRRDVAVHADAGHPDLPSITFPVGLPGFSRARRFSVEPSGAGSVAVLLTCTSGATVRFAVVSPAPWFPRYAPEIDRDVLDALELDDPTGVSLWVILTLGDRRDETTANLLGPLAVNHRRALAVQALQSGVATLSQRRGEPARGSRTPLRRGAGRG